MKIAGWLCGFLMVTGFSVQRPLFCQVQSIKSKTLIQQVQEPTRLPRFQPFAAINNQTLLSPFLPTPKPPLSGASITSKSTIWTQIRDFPLQSQKPCHLTSSHPPSDLLLLHKCQSSIVYLPYYLPPFSQRTSQAASLLDFSYLIWMEKI